MRGEGRGDSLTWRERGDGARIGDEYIELLEPLQHAPHSVPRALNVPHVRRKNEHFRLPTTVCSGGSGNYVTRLFEGVRIACDDRYGRTRARILQRSLTPDAARGARDEHDFARVGLRGVVGFWVDCRIDAVVGAL